MRRYAKVDKKTLLRRRVLECVSLQDLECVSLTSLSLIAHVIVV